MPSSRKGQGSVGKLKKPFLCSSRFQKQIFSGKKERPNSRERRRQKATCLPSLSLSLSLSGPSSRLYFGKVRVVRLPIVINHPSFLYFSLYVAPNRYADVPLKRKFASASLVLVHGTENLRRSRERKNKLLVRGGFPARYFSAFGA